MPHLTKPPWALKTTCPLSSAFLRLLLLAIFFTLSSTTVHADSYTTAHDFTGGSEGALSFGVTPRDIAVFCRDRYAPSGYKPEDEGLFDTLRMIRDIPSINTLAPPTGPNPFALSEDDARKLLYQLHRATDPLTTDKNTFESLIRRVSIFYPLNNPENPSVGFRLASWNWTSGEGFVKGRASCSWVTNSYGASVTGDLEVSGLNDYVDYTARFSAALNHSGGSMDFESGANFHLGKLAVDLYNTASN